MRNFIKEQKGITLIALVITIIVLLILAGVAITMITGEGGILQQAADAKKSSEEASIQEQIELAYLSAIANKDGKVKIEELNKELNKIETNSGTVTEFPATVTIKGQQYTISEKGEVTKGNGGGENTPVQPKVGEWVSYSGGGINKWRIVEVKDDGTYVVYARVSEKENIDTIPASYDATGANSEELYFAGFFGSDYALDARLGDVKKYIENLTGKKISTRYMSGSVWVDEEVVTDSAVDSADLEKLGITNGERLCTGWDYDASMGHMGESASIDVVNETVFYSDYGYSSPNYDGFIALTLKSGLTFTGAGTEASPYTITASNS